MILTVAVALAGIGGLLVETGAVTGTTGVFDIDVVVVEFKVVVGGVALLIDTVVFAG